MPKYIKVLLCVFLMFFFTQNTYANNDNNVLSFLNISTNNTNKNNNKEYRTTNLVFSDITDKQSLDDIKTTQSLYLNERTKKINEMKKNYPNLAQLTNVDDSTITLYENSNENSKIIAYVSQNHIVQILLEEVEWSYISCENLNGYVKTSNIQKDNTYELLYKENKDKTNINIENIKSIINDLNKNLNIEKVYHIKQNYLDKSNTDTIMATKDELTQLRLDIVNYSLNFVGNPYVRGGTSLTNGADCSGFVMRLYYDFDIIFSRSLYQQAKTGLEVSINELEPGDLILYGDYTYQHVAMYIGNGKIIHASTPTYGIVTANYNIMNILTCRRIIF